MVGPNSFFLAAAASSALFQVGAAVPWTSKRQNGGGSNSACARLSQVYDETSLRNLPIVAPSEAYACLRSIPLDADRDAALLEWLAPYMEFQSTIGILADPPPGYMYPGVDILGGLSNMTQMLQDGEYDNQYDFVVDLYRLINVKSREGHLNYQPTLVNVVQFETPILFISVSEDGLSLPEVYVFQDYIAGITSGFESSAVESYDGVPITQWLEQRAVDNAPSQDPDASYNMQLWSAPLENIGATRRPLRFYHSHLNDTSDLVFKNGTELSVENYAILQGDWSGITSGLGVHQRFEIPSRTGSPQSDPILEGRGNAGSLPDLMGYPDPLLQHSDNYLSAYLFGSDEGVLSDTAVIAVKSFMSNDPSADVFDDITEFTSVVNQFVQASDDAGVERLIIDFQGNGGGTLGNLVGLYNVLFPDTNLFLHMRARATEVLDWIGSTADRGRVDISNFFPFDYRSQIGDDLEGFETWSDFYDLEEILGDEFTQLFQPAYMVALTEFPQRFSESLHGPYFDPNNTVIVTDGYCASACAMAVGLMSRLLGINTVAMGGRPIEAPMQAIGGTKGGPVVALAMAQLVFNDVANYREPPSSLNAAPFYTFSPLAGPGPESFVINSANVHLHNDPNGTPAQFVYEAANCKLFYTWDTLHNMTTLWEAVANVEWNGAPCVAGSTANDDNTLAQEVPAFSQDYVANLTWVAGPGDVSDRPPTGDVPDHGGDTPGNGGGGGGNGGSPDDPDNAAAGVRVDGVATVVTLMAALLMLLV